VPILRNIPIVNLFFERKAQFKENRKTLILLTSSIVIPREMAPSAAMLGRDE
jgi:type II secretory pathway component GspD/PulD (secretin)